MSDIELLSELRSRFSLFDDHEQPYYHALSEAIRAMNMVQSWVAIWRNDYCMDASAETVGRGRG